MSGAPEQDYLLTIEIGLGGKILRLKSEMPKWLEKREKALAESLLCVNEEITEEHIRAIYEYKIVREEPFPLE